MRFSLLPGLAYRSRIPEKQSRLQIRQISSVSGRTLPSGWSEAWLRWPAFKNAYGSVTYARNLVRCRRCIALGTFTDVRFSWEGRSACRPTNKEKNGTARRPSLRFVAPSVKWSGRRLPTASPARTVLPAAHFDRSERYASFGDRTPESMTLRVRLQGAAAGDALFSSLSHEGAGEYDCVNPLLRLPSVRRQSCIGISSPE